ncbi:MAG: HAD family hydrolase [Holdemania massiliensis]
MFSLSSETQVTFLHLLFAVFDISSAPRLRFMLVTSKRFLTFSDLFPRHLCYTFDKERGMAMTDYKPIRLLASDLDGTLYDDLQHPGQISAANQAAIRRWTEAGNRFLIATGDAPAKQEIFKNYQIDCDILACVVESHPG